jgi:hypothetical protein
MAAYGIGPAGVTTITPAARDPYVKMGVLEVADGSTGFAAFGLPKYAVVVGVYAISAGANTTQTINVGFTNGGVELVDTYAPNSTGYAAIGGTDTGASVGVQLTSDKTVYLKASATLTSRVIVKVEYIIPPQGLSL